MEVINELKTFDSLHNEWETIGTNIVKDKEFETNMHRDEIDTINFEGIIYRKSRKGLGDDIYFEENNN